MVLVVEINRPNAPNTSQDDADMDMLALPSDFNSVNNAYQGASTDYELEVPRLQQMEPLMCTDTDYVGALV